MPDEIKPAPLLLAESATVYATADAFGHEQGKTNAHLFAAAVDLLAALVDLAYSADTAAAMLKKDYPAEAASLELRIETAKAAIAKAKGGE